MYKVLIVDDSAFMRNALSSMISSDPEISVCGMARDGYEAIEKVESLKPDIMTLDVEMPKMDGITALKHIMDRNPLPVIMVSSLTMDGAKVTLEALELGAVDFIPKNLSDLSVNIVNIKEILIEKVKLICKKNPAKKIGVRKTALRSKPEVLPLPPVRTTGERKTGVVSIGTSTGGPKALQELITKLPKKFPVPILVAQHMPQNFTGPFSDRLNQLSEITVKEAEDGEVLKPGTVFIAPGRGNMRVVRKKGLDIVIKISEDKGEFIYRPSVDALFTSAAQYYPGRVLAVVLTGMGNDGVVGAQTVKSSGGRIFAQNEDSCVIYGMPKAVVDASLADKIISLPEMAGEIINAV